MEEKIKPQDLQSAFLNVDIASLMREWNHGEQVGQQSRISELDDVFKWMPGTINAWYGWANDGKGTFFDFMAVMKAKFDNYKFCFLKQEDMSSTRFEYEPGKFKNKVTANRIHKSLAWTFTGKTPYQKFADRYKIQKIGWDEYEAALDWVNDHFVILHTKDRRFKTVMEYFKFAYEKWGINAFLIDPFKSLKLEETKRTDFMMDDLFIECKEFAQETNSSFNFIAHPKSLSETKDKDGKYKVVNQYMVSGGASWDNNMDSQYSIYRPMRHDDVNDPSVHFYNLKQRNAEEVLAYKGVYEKIKLNRLTRRYFFDGVCPLSPGDVFGTAIINRPDIGAVGNIFEQKTPASDPDEVPF